jgi:hypothetical protein
MDQAQSPKLKADASAEKDLQTWPSRPWFVKLDLHQCMKGQSETVNEIGPVRSIQFSRSVAFF